MASETGEMRRKGAIFDGAPAPERAVLLEIPAGLNVRAAVAVAMRALAAFWYAKMRDASRKKKNRREAETLDGPEVYGKRRRNLSSVVL